MFIVQCVHQIVSSFTGSDWGDAGAGWTNIVLTGVSKSLAMYGKSCPLWMLCLSSPSLSPMINYTLSSGWRFTALESLKAVSLWHFVSSTKKRKIRRKYSFPDVPLLCRVELMGYEWMQEWFLYPWLRWVIITHWSYTCSEKVGYYENLCPFSNTEHSNTQT